MHRQEQLNLMYEAANVLLVCFQLAQLIDCNLDHAFVTFYAKFCQIVIFEIKKRTLKYG